MGVLDSFTAGVYGIGNRLGLVSDEALAAELLSMDPVRAAEAKDEDPVRVASAAGEAARNAVAPTVVQAVTDPIGTMAKGADVIGQEVENAAGDLIGNGVSNLESALAGPLVIAGAIVVAILWLVHEGGGLKVKV